MIKSRTVWSTIVMHFSANWFQGTLLGNNARIYISWLNTQVSFDISTGLDQKILSFISENLILRDSDNPDLYQSAIEYYLWHQQDRKQVMKFIDRGIALKNDRIWYY